MKKLYIVFFSGIFCSVTANAQDPHFSQYHASPLTLNPAMTGYSNGDGRITANFRHQWRTAGAPFTTGTISYDTKILKDKTKKDILGFGILGLYDQSSNGAFKNSNVSASLSYLKAMNPQATSFFGLGFQLTYAARFINTNKLSFANQFNGSGFDTNLPSNEGFGSLQRDYLDLNAGLLYTFKDAHKELYVGGSIYHITTPNISFLANEQSALPQRYSAQVGSKILVGDNKNELLISGIYMYQAAAQERNVGISYGVNARNDVMIYGGLWYRIQDAFIPYIGLNYKNFGFGVSYDINNSDLKNYSSGNGSFELSLYVLTTKNPDPKMGYKTRTIF